MVLPKEASQTRVLCKKFLLPSDYYSIAGTITFVQEENKPWSDTTVLVDVVNAQQSETLQHNWHIHKDPVGADYLPEDGRFGSGARCGSTGPHWNPFEAPIGGTDKIFFCYKHDMCIEETYVIKIANPYPVMQSQDCGNDCLRNAISLSIPYSRPMQIYSLKCFPPLLW